MAAVMVCTVCDKVGVVPRKNGLPTGWRRVTISNPDNLKKRGITGAICSAGCAGRFVKDGWDGPVLGLVA